MWYLDVTRVASLGAPAVSHRSVPTESVEPLVALGHEDRGSVHEAAVNSEGPRMCMNRASRLLVHCVRDCGRCGRGMQQRLLHLGCKLAIKSSPYCRGTRCRSPVDDDSLVGSEAHSVFNPHLKVLERVEAQLCGAAHVVLAAISVGDQEVLLGLSHVPFNALNLDVFVDSGIEDDLARALLKFDVSRAHLHEHALVGVCHVAGDGLGLHALMDEGVPSHSTRAKSALGAAVSKDDLDELGLACDVPLTRAHLNATVLHAVGAKEGRPVDQLRAPVDMLHEDELVFIGAIRLTQDALEEGVHNHFYGRGLVQDAPLWVWDSFGACRDAGGGQQRTV
mmetsp:Transcript_7943/g.21759  ORF Transcript_7943/g.21759 Transcript_7943/m.21759 type:complete len:336 (+) Transcript_7943:1190-2197(+)